MFIVCASQVAEEKRLRSEQASALEVVRKKVREEEEEEEARLMEAKQDVLRKLQQQVRRERQGEKGIGGRKKGEERGSGTMESDWRVCLIDLSGSGEGGETTKR